MQSDLLSNELSTADRLLLDEEHARLEQFWHDLRETCTEFESGVDCRGCSQDLLATCQGRLVSFIYDFLDLTAEHFEHEEAILRRLLPSPDDDVHVHAHQMEHVRLLRVVHDLAREAARLNTQGLSAEAIRLLYRKICELFGEHARNYDTPFLGLH